MTKEEDMKRDEGVLRLILCNECGRPIMDHTTMTGARLVCPSPAKVRRWYIACDDLRCALLNFQAAVTTSNPPTATNYAPLWTSP